MLKIVPHQDWEVLRKYLPFGGGVILMKEELYNSLPTEVRDAAKETAAQYNFEDADVSVEIVSDDSHYFVTCCKEEAGLDDEEAE